MKQANNRVTKGFAAVLAVIIVVLVLAAGGGVFYYFQKNQSAGDVVTSNDLLEVSSPVPGQKIRSPVLVSGKSNFFEAHTRIRITDDNGQILADTFTTAEGWMDQLYPFSKEVSYGNPSAKKGIVEVFAESAKDGSEISKITIPVVFQD